MSAYYATLDLELVVKTKDQNDQKAKLEKELRSTQDSKSVFPDQLKKVVKSLTKNDDHISELTEEGKDQYTFQLVLC